MLRIHNSSSGREEPLEPIVPGRVGMYVCGMTVYDYCHLGHARMLLVFDMVSRYLRASGFDVTYVRNITDIEDKIIARAQESGEPTTAVTERFIAAMHEDCAALGIEPPDVEPRATEYVAPMIAHIEQLVAKGVAYPADNGDVYFEVRRFPDYGKLSGNRLEDLQAGARVEVDAAKRAPEDFVLWKAAKPGEPSWPSPWGPGRPGWHIECSVMSMSNLGQRFDIHGGGKDLIFPHHECEVAQSEALTGAPFVNVWMHNGFVRIEDEKMSKSLGNFFTIRELLARVRGEVVRYYLLTSHYRSPLSYAPAELEGAGHALARLYTALRGIDLGGEAPASPEAAAPWEARFRAAMDNDFNTPEALAVLFDLAREVNRARSAEPEQARALAHPLRRLGGILGLLQADPDAFLKGGAGAADEAPDAEAIEALITERAAARAARDFAAADRIRDELAAQGIVLEDSGPRTTWRRAG